LTQYLCLMKMTPKGRAEIAKSLDRGSEIQDAIAELGVTRLDYWVTLGGFDCVMLFDAPDDAAMGHALMKIGTFGAVETQTLSVIGKDDYAAILAQLARETP